MRKRTPSVLPSEEVRAGMSRVIGQRLREARELCNMTQSTAARRLGYANSAPLSRIESADDRYPIPLWVVADAAQLYHVSADFLLGLTEEWDPEERPVKFRETAQWMYEAWETLRERDLFVLRKLHHQVNAIAQSVREMLSETRQLADVLAKFREQNPAFDDMPVGASLVFMIERVAQATSRSDVRLRGMHDDCAAIRKARQSEAAAMPLPF